MASYGTYGARVVAIEKYISDNNMYRILLARDQEDQPWPEVAVGSGARTIALLNNVPVWYEIWRQLNAFPWITILWTLREIMIQLRRSDAVLGFSFRFEYLPGARLFFEWFWIT